MRIDILARKENETTIYKVFDNVMDAMFFEWEMRMQGYKTKGVTNG